MQSQSLKQGSNLSSKSTAVFKKILVAVDGSDSAMRAAKDAVGLAEKLHADLIVLHAISPPGSYLGSNYPSLSGVSPPPISQREIDSYYEYSKKAATRMIDGAVGDTKKLGIKVKTEIIEGASSIVETIINHADHEQADLIVVGTRGLGGFKKLLIGSVSSGVISHANCPVLIVR